MRNFLLYQVLVLGLMWMLILRLMEMAAEKRRVWRTLMMMKMMMKIHEENPQSPGRAGHTLVASSFEPQHSMIVLQN
jgi:hypothetical protein